MPRRAPWETPAQPRRKSSPPGLSESSCWGFPCKHGPTQVLRPIHPNHATRAWCHFLIIVAGAHGHAAAKPIHARLTDACLIRDKIPSLIRGRPGPSRATDPKPRLTVGLERAFKMGPCAMPAHSNQVDSGCRLGRPDSPWQRPSRPGTMPHVVVTAADLQCRGQQARMKPAPYSTPAIVAIAWQA